MLKPLKPKNIISILLKNWFIQKRQTGSHIVFRKDEKIVIVPYHGSKDTPIPTLKSIIKQSWLDESLFY
jgi:predicted RNA binding protein YcfA (HicA-like mRNA interferase family)